MSMEFNEANFEAEVINSDIPVVVDFSAPWCGPCKILGPIIDRASAEYTGKVKIGKVNVDDNPDLSTKYDITGVPSVLIFKNGAVVDSKSGLMSMEMLKQKIDAIL